jgi:hypothetical protein
VPDEPRAKSAAPMSKKLGKKASTRRPAATAIEEMRPEYDFSKAKPNPYARRFETGATVVVLDPDVAQSFPDARSVNTALRDLVDRRTKASK